MQFNLFEKGRRSPWPFAKMLLVMKLTAMLMLIVSLHVSAGGFAQKIQLNLRNASVVEAVREIQNQTGYAFLYTRDDLRGLDKLNLSISSRSIETVLNKCFTGLPLDYVVEKAEKVVILKRKTALGPLNRIRHLFQQPTVHGLVVDTAGLPLPGVSVMVKDQTSIGTSTDINGRYSLQVPENATLIFSMVGFQEQQIPVNGRTEINIVLEGSTSQLGDVVVVAFGKQKKEEVVGAVTTINPAELKVPSSNLTTALAGRLAGVIAYQRSGEPGQDNADFFIRGVTTFGYKKDPLILIDGIELTATDLARLQPDDVASFSIMKDATATALYGARGANGVILITTKEGKEGKAAITVRLENSISTPTRDVELADPITYMRLHNEAVLTRDPLGILPYSDQKIENTIQGVNPYVFPVTDWKKELFKDYTMNQRVNMNVSGGGSVARYYVAGSFNQDNGVLKVDQRNNFNNNIDLKSYTLRSNVNVNLTPITEMVIRLSGSFDDYTGPIDGGAGLYRKVMRTNPVMFPAYYPVDEEHRYVQHTLFGNFEDGRYLNPYADMVRGYMNYSRTNLGAQLEFKQNLSFLTEGLKARALMNTSRYVYFDVTRAYNPFYYHAGSYDKVNNTYRLQLFNEDTGTEYLNYQPGAKTVNSSFYLESALNYDRTFADKHTLSGLLVFMLRSSLTGNAEDLQQSLPFRNVGLAGRATYSYDNRSFAEFNFGYNGSERFHHTHRYGFFPSAGLAWSVSNEAFWEPLKQAVPSLRLRGTYGLVGNDAIGDGRFLYLSNVNMNDSGRGGVFGTDNGYSRDGISLSRYADPNITWETAAKTNIGLEMNLFDQIDIQADYFTEHRTNILMQRTATPATMGLLAQPHANIGEVKGKGIDFSIDYNKAFQNSFWLQGRVNFTYATSKYLVYEEPAYDEAPWKLHVGFPVGQQWGYIAERLFVDDEEALKSPRQNFGEYGGGDIKFHDVNGDGQITALDQVPIGYPTTPEIVYGFGFSVGYRAFDLSAFFQGLARESFWIDASATAPFVAYHYNDAEANSGIIYQNALLQAYANDHWSEENRNLYALWPRLSSTNNNNNSQRSTWFMRDGLFLRLKSVELGYNLPPAVAQRLKVKTLRLYASGTNLMTWSKFKLWDVEMAGNGLGYPIQKVYNLGLLVSF